VARLAGIPDDVIKRSKQILTSIENEGRGTARPSGSGRRQPESGQIQLDLFHHPDQEIIDRLRHIDVSRTTPIDALNLLSELQDRVRSDA
jgi:DNA mismatch repair protein MutS